LVQLKNLKHILISTDQKKRVHGRKDGLSML
jgi:hypothetical protein